MTSGLGLSTPHRSRGRRANVGVICVVLTLGVVGFGCSDDEPSAATDEPSVPTVASVPSEASDESVPTQPGSTVVPPTSPAATAVEQPPIGVDTLPPVSLAVPAQVESGLEFVVVAIRDVEAEPEEGTDDIVGPAVAVDIDVVNNGDDPVELDRFIVSAGASDAELSPILGSFGEPFAGVLAPGDTASATYGFRTGGESVTLLRLDDGLSRSIAIVVP